MKIILILTANPNDSTRLRLDTEYREIDDSLRKSNQREQFTLAHQPATRIQDLQQAMLNHQPNLVHFCGHGEVEAGLVLENEQGNSVLVSTEALAEFFALFVSHVECVLLNACYSEVQANAIARHIPYVIGMSQAISDQAALRFSTAFYKALGAGQNIEFAYKMACNDIKLAGIPEDLTPRLLNRRQQQNQLFDDAQAAEARYDYATALQCWQTLAQFAPVHPKLADALQRLERKQAAQERLKQLNVRLIKRMKDITPVYYRKVGVDLKRVQEQGIDEEAELMLDVLEQFLDDEIGVEDFKAFWDSEADARLAAKVKEQELDYVTLRRRLNDGYVALFIGMDVTPPQPDTAAMTHHLKQLAACEQLNDITSEISEYLQISQHTRRSLVSGVEALLHAATPSNIPFYNILARVPVPLMIIHAAYDDLLEQNFKRHNKRFVQISHQQRYHEHGSVTLDIVYSDREQNESCLAENFSGLQVMEQGYSLIYRVRGYLADNKKDCLLLSEQDYLNFAKYMDELIPNYIIQQLNDRNFWFLGHYLTTWEDRLLVSAILDKRNSIKGTTPAQAVHAAPNAFAQAYWTYQRVDVHDVSLEEFVKGIE